MHILYKKVSCIVSVSLVRRVVYSAKFDDRLHSWSGYLNLSPTQQFIHLISILNFF